VLAADGFVPLHVWLARPAPAGEPDVPAAPAPEPDPPRAEAPVAPALAAATADAVRDLRLFRARLAEALELATGELLRELAYAVLGRELRLAPADVAELAARILAEHRAAEPVTIRHAPGEPIDLGVPAVADAALAPGDLIVVFASGDVDARFGVRLAGALEAHA
jgi:flagellar biosynthesis/type III secretory pathway protein FliH